MLDAAGRSSKMKADHTKYLVTRPDEARAGGSGPSSSIPTFGAATTAIDQYRTVGIHDTNIGDLSVALTDIPSVAAIAKIAEGGIVDYREIDAAEVALQALLLHDYVHVVTHAPKVEFENGLITYARLDRGMRTDFGFELFQLADSRDWMIAPEYVREQDGQIIESSLRNSPLVGKTLEDVRNQETRFTYWNNEIADAINTTIQEHGVPLYLSDDGLTKARRGDGFSKHFYHRMRISWNKAVGDLPPIVSTFALPPLLAIVFDRLDNRADLKSVIKDLREETEGVRVELHQLNSLVTSSQSQSEIENQINHIVQSFDAIIPESRLSDAQRVRRKISVVHRLVRPIIKFMAALATGTGMSYDDIVQSAGGIEKLVLESESVVDRTVTAKTYSKLVDTEAIQSLVKHHFTPAEITAIERSLAKENQ